MKETKAILILILIVLSTTCVSALWVKNSRNETANCMDYTDKEFHEYMIKYDKYDNGNSYYTVVDAADSPFTYDDLYGYTEYPKKLNENDVLAIDEAQRTATRKRFYDAAYAGLQPDPDIPIYVAHMSWVPFSPGNAASNIASEKSFLEYFIITDECLPCEKRESDLHLFENYGECIPCEDWSSSYAYAWDEEKGYCVLCGDNEESINDQCVPCKNGEKLVKGNCQICDYGKAIVNGECQKCQDDEVIKDEKCVKCQSNEVVKNGKCVKCAANEVILAGKCHRCADNEVIENGACWECESNEVVKNGKCVKCGTNEIIVAGQCKACKDDEEPIDNECIPIPEVISNPGNNGDSGDGDSGDGDSGDSEGIGDNGNNDNTNLGGTGLGNIGDGSNPKEDKEPEKGGVVECAFEKLWKDFLGWFTGYSKLSDECQLREDYEKELKDEGDDTDDTLTDKEKAEKLHPGWKIVSSHGLGESTTTCDAGNLDCTRKGYQGAECRAGYCMEKVENN